MANPKRSRLKAFVKHIGQDAKKAASRVKKGAGDAEHAAETGAKDAIVGVQDGLKAAGKVVKKVVDQ
jgi:hypothetical protein